MSELETFISWLERRNISYEKVGGEKFTFIYVERAYAEFSFLFRDGMFLDIRTEESL